ncbi:MAG: hypothetical protein OHK0040_10620 [bacterium]
MKPNPFQILKMLPQTNCKECGFETCLALATYIYAYGPEALNKCTCIEDETKKKIKDLFGKEEDNKAGSMIAMWEEFRKKLKNLNFDSLAGLNGFKRLSDRTVSFKLLDDEIVVTEEDIIKPAGTLCEHDKILIFYYLNCADKLTGEFEFCDYRSFYSKLKVRDVKQESFEVKVQEAFGNDTEKLKKVLLGLGGRPTEYYKDLYDLSMMLMIFPNVPVLILYSSGEEEFSPFCKFMFDKGCSLCFDSEGLEYLADYVVDKILE